MSDKKIDKYALVLLALFMSLIFVGCENTIQPLDRENGVFSIYGVLDLKKELNFVRVKDLNRTLLQDTVGTIDATVVIEDLKNGNTDVMQDSIVAFDGIKTHNFYTGMDILPDSRYRVSVERSDGRTVTVEAETPNIAETDVTPVMEDCLTRINVTFTPVKKRIYLRMNVGFNYNGELEWITLREDLGGRPDDLNSGENTEIYSFRPKDILNSFTGYDPDFYPDAKQIWCHQLDNGQFYIDYTHYGSEFFKATTSDSLEIPKGTGRLGAFYKDTLDFQIDTVNVCKPDC